MIVEEYVVIITDDFLFSAGVWAFIVVWQILDWQQSHWHVLVK